MQKVMVVLTGLLCLVSASSHAGKLYKWVDKDGNVSYQDTPPPSNAGRVEQKNLYGGSRKTGDATLDAIAEQNPVVLYYAPKCAACDIARLYLNNRKVPFKEKNAGEDIKVQEELRQKSGTLGVPTILVGPNVIREYSQAWLERELDQAGYPKVGESGPAQVDADGSADGSNSADQ